jgi:hypothetical protein
MRRVSASRWPRFAFSRPSQRSLIVSSSHPTTTCAILSVSRKSARVGSTSAASSRWSNSLNCSARSSCSCSTRSASVARAFPFPFRFTGRFLTAFGAGRRFCPSCIEGADCEVPVVAWSRYSPAGRAGGRWQRGSSLLGGLMRPWRI